ncbi:molybdopterin converting factor subunit 1 [Salinibacillus xinjiangensis]|uniref:Molybdopterin synthase sulfur carrier subunit n=1 Tax=Salinibacillus xinjiangensis TaxID=1229268 RepID=A0A6G1X420_9BACI|nr:molybdopterin converting factor subunit 1 [Salinibacillus xinjiangensis]MRG85655.1 molybdopterin converting factor subunit 1 [Salinibacillus xinjiangensis]
MINVLFFAGLAEKTGQREIQLEHIAGSTVEQLKEKLMQEYPQAKAEMSQAMIAVNEEYAEKTDTLQERDTVAFIPPVSGG